MNNVKIPALIFLFAAGITAAAVWQGTIQYQTLVEEELGRTLERGRGRYAAEAALQARETLDQASLVAEKLHALYAGASRQGSAIERERPAVQRQLTALREEVPADLLLVTDAGGKVLARASQPDRYGDSLAGTAVIRDALSGYQRDGLWSVEGDLYRVGVAPVVERGAVLGAVLVGYQYNQVMAERLRRQTGMDAGFVYRGKHLAGTLGAMAHSEIVQAMGGRATLFDFGTAGKPSPLLVDLDGRAYLAAIGSIRGQQSDAYYYLTVSRAAALQPLVDYQRFLIAAGGGGGLLLSLLVWILLRVGVQRPLNKLADHLSAFNQRGSEREFVVRKVPRQFRRLAKLINMTVEKVPMRPVGGTLSTVTATPVGAPLPPVPESASSVPPPPPIPFPEASGAEAIDASPAAAAMAKDLFEDSDHDSSGGYHGAEEEDRTRIAPLPLPGMSPDFLADSASEEPAADDYESQPDATRVYPIPQELIEAGRGGTIADLPPEFSDGADEPTNAGVSPVDLHFQAVYEEFLQMRRQCGESTQELSYERFRDKLVRSRENLMAKYSCEDVRFQVYEKQGRAALKASPVRG